MMWLRLWNDCVEAACLAFNASRAKAMLFVIALFMWVGMMIASTWFIWAGIIVTVSVVLATLMSIEYSLRAWYWLHHCDCPQRPVAPHASLEHSVPDRLVTPCADSQGRIEKTDLCGHDIDAMAAQILRRATVRKTWSRRPSWLHFPAICRAMPWLARFGRVVNIAFVE
jgi:hypothetical protein